MVPSSTEFTVGHTLLHERTYQVYKSVILCIFYIVSMIACITLLFSFLVCFEKLIHVFFWTTNIFRFEKVDKPNIMSLTDTER